MSLVRNDSSDMNEDRTVLLVQPYNSTTNPVPFSVCEYDEKCENVALAQF